MIPFFLLIFCCTLISAADTQMTRMTEQERARQRVLAALNKSVDNYGAASDIAARNRDRLDHIEEEAEERLHELEEGKRELAKHNKKKAQEIEEIKKRHAKEDRRRQRQEIDYNCRRKCKGSCWYECARSCFPCCFPCICCDMPLDLAELDEEAKDAKNDLESKETEGK